MCDDDSRNDRHMAHFESRAVRPTQHACPNAPITATVSDSAGMRETVDAGARFAYVGTSPVLSPEDQVQARRRYFTFMADN